MPLLGFKRLQNVGTRKERISNFSLYLISLYLIGPNEAKCMVTLTTMFVLSEYLTPENVQHSSGKLRVRGVQIRGLLGNVLNRGEMKCV